MTMQIIWYKFYLQPYSHHFVSHTLASGCHLDATRHQLALEWEALKHMIHIGNDKICSFRAHFMPIECFWEVFKDF